VEFVLNELSIHGQFASLGAFYESLRTVLELRGQIERKGWPLRSSRQALERPVTEERTLRKALYEWPDRNLRQVALIWLTNKGPFWEDEPLHGPDDWFECEEEIVTGSSLAEAASALACRQPRDLLSIAPSGWMRSPILVQWVRSQEDRTSVTLANHWEETSLRQRLEALQRPLASSRAG
jgi:hypothetical protein